MNNLQPTSDLELIRNTLQDADQFAYLMERYEGKLMRYIKRLANFDHATAEDVLQEVFIKIYQNLNDFDQKLTFSSWAYRITYNHVISTVRKIKARPQIINPNDEDTIQDFLTLVPSSANLPKEFNQKQLAEKVQIILKQVPEKYRTVLILYYLEDKDYQEISDILRKSIGTVSTLLYRAKKQFKKQAQKYELDICLS